MTGLVVVVLLAQVAGAWLLARTLHPATIWWSVAPAAAASLAADLLLAHSTDDSFHGLGGALGLGLVAVFLGQLVRVPRPELIQAVSAGCGTLLVTAPAATLVGLDGLPSGSRPVIAIAAAALIGTLPLPAPRFTGGPWLTGVLRVAIGTLAASLVCTHSSHVEAADGLLIGLAASVAAFVGERTLAPAGRTMVPLLVGITAGSIIGRGILG